MAVPAQPPRSFADLYHPTLQAIPHVADVPPFQRVDTIHSAKGRKVYLAELAHPVDGPSAVIVKQINKPSRRDPQGVEGVFNEVLAACWMIGERPSYSARVLFVAQDEQRFYLVTEHFQNGDLFQALQRAMAKKRVMPVLAVNLFLKAMQAVQEMHASGVVHRDLSLENFLIGSTGTKIIDFAQALTIQVPEQPHEEPLCPRPTASGGRCGKPQYRAPEVRDDLQYFGSKVDMYTMGIVLYLLLVQTYPPTEMLEGDDPEANINSGVRVALATAGRFGGRHSPMHIPEVIVDLLEQLLAPNPLARPSAVEVLAMLENQRPAWSPASVVPPKDAALANPTEAAEPAAGQGEAKATEAPCTALPHDAAQGVAGAGHAAHQCERTRSAPGASDDSSINGTTTTARACSGADSACSTCTSAADGDLRAAATCPLPAMHGDQKIEGKIVPPAALDDDYTDYNCNIHEVVEHSDSDGRPGLEAASTW